MNRQKKKNNLKQRRHARIRALVHGSSEVPRVAVFKSRSHIYGQVINDDKGMTIVAQHDWDLKKDEKAGKDQRVKEQIAFSAGKLLAEKMKKNKILKAVFDRGGFKYHGRIKAFADGLRKGGIKI